MLSKNFLNKPGHRQNLQPNVLYYQIRAALCHGFASANFCFLETTKLEASSGVRSVCRWCRGGEPAFVTAPAVQPVGIEIVRVCFKRLAGLQERP